MKRLLSEAWKYLPGTAIFAFLVWSAGPIRRQLGFSVDPTFLIILTMVATAWYLGRGPGLLLAISFEVTLNYFAGAPKDPVRFATIAFNRLLLFTGIVLFASARREAEKRLLTQQKSLEDTLERERAARKEAEDANRMKDEFLSTVSHELRTPLNALLGWASILEKHNPEPEVARRAAEAIGRSARAQAQIVEDVLDMSSIAAGAMRVEKDVINVSPAIEEAVESGRQAAAEKGITIAVSLTPEAMVIGDAGRIRQIASNLVWNAIKFTPSGGKVSVSVQCVKDTVELQVADTGSGITPEFLPHVFERFRQGDASFTREHGGLGLGLAIVHQLTESHGGTVHASSEGLGRGSVFTVRLPMATRGSDVPPQTTAPMVMDVGEGV